MKRTITIISLMLILVEASFAQETETRQLNDFTEVSVGEAVKLTLVKGSKNEAKITSSNIDLRDIETEVSGDRLRIGIDGRHYNNIGVSITLTYKEIDELNVSSAANAKTEGAIKTENFEITVSSAGEANIEIEVKKLKVDVSSAGDLWLKGKAINQMVEVSSAGDYEGFELVCEVAAVRVSSAGSAEVNATKEIEANANSGGSINYKGNPDKVYVNSSSGGSVKKY
ncbi:MAG: head GIN domain-containing protein [Bacteroidota bacterium]